jgi:dienelactone hydrolase
MGGDDLFTPAQECIPLLEKLREQKLPVEWYLFPKATHVWDAPDLDGYTMTTYRGTRVTFRYDPAVTEDSRKRLFDFLTIRMGTTR